MGESRKTEELLWWSGACALDGAAQHEPGVVGAFEVDGRLPQLDGVGYDLERLAQHAPAHRHVGLERGGVDPDLDRLWDLLDGLREDLSAWEVMEAQ